MVVPYKRINITLHPDTLGKLDKLAEENQRSRSNMISFLIERADNKK